MVVKGIISAIYEDQKKISVILPEYDNMTTQPLPIYGTPNMDKYKVNEFVVVFVFNGDFTDAVIMSANSSSSSSSDSGLELGETETTAYRGDRGKIAYEHSKAKHAPSDAQKNVQTDWNENDTKSDAYFKNKPSKFPPSEHKHKWGEVEEKPTEFPPSSHNHSWDSIDNKPNSFTPSEHRHSWDGIDNKPETFPPSGHKHKWGEVEEKPTEFPPSSHNHSWDSIQNKPDTFPPSSHGHSWNDITATKDNIIKTLGYTPLDASSVVEDTTYAGCYYRMVNGEKEWLNPPMVLATEYRTTERYNGEVVYTQLLDLGALPNATTKIVSTGVASAGAFDMQMDLHMAQGQLACFPYMDSSMKLLTRAFLAVNGDFYINTNTDMSAYTAKVKLKYTK